MKKIILLLMILFGNTVYAQDISAPQNISAPQIVENNTTKVVSYYEFDTFCDKDNLKNNWFRGYLNRIGKLLPDDNSGIVFKFIGFVLFTMAFLLSPFAALQAIIIPISDILHGNPAAAIGYFIDVVSTEIKLFLVLIGL